jgi:hypothetical protein
MKDRISARFTEDSLGEYGEYIELSWVFTDVETNCTLFTREAFTLEEAREVASKLASAIKEAEQAREGE